MPPTQVPMKFLVPVVPEGEEELDTSGGVVVEMCPECFALAPTDRIQRHIDKHQPPERPDIPEPPPTVEAT